MTAAALPLRRTWLAKLLKQANNGFVALLRALVPGARVEPGDPLNAYWALLDHVGTLFPTYEPEADRWTERAEMEIDEGEDSSVLDQAFYDGIPVQLYGLSQDDAHYARPVVALACYLCNAWVDGVPQQLLEIGLEPILARKLCLSPQAANAPRGRQWPGVWAGLPDLVAYVKHDTGCSILDYSDDDVADGMEPPEWNLDEIRGLAADWKHGEPMWKRIKALVNDVGDDRARLLDLGRLLVGDPEARRELSVVKRTKTLAQIFTRGRHAQA